MAYKYGTSNKTNRMKDRQKIDKVNLENMLKLYIK